MRKGYLEEWTDTGLAIGIRLNVVSRFVVVVVVVDVDVDVVGADGVDAWADGVVDVVGVAELLLVL